MSLQRCAVLLCVSMALNELAIVYFDSRVILAAWALACLWILFDASLIAVQLAHTEALLQAQYKRNESMHEQNVAFSLQILHNSDNHLLLCELRTRITVLSQRCREHHSISIADPPMLKKGNSEGHIKLAP